MSTPSLNASPMNYPTDSYVPKPTSRPMTVAEKLTFALVYPVIAPVLLVVVAAILLTAYPVILAVGTVSHEHNSNG